MIVYHMSETLSLGDELRPDYQAVTELVQPFVQALERSEDCFSAMILNAKYFGAVLQKFKLREWSNYIKWSVEGAFEYVRKTEFPQCCSRVGCNYFYDSLPNCKRLFEYDWGEESKETRDAIHLYEIELNDDPPRFDMRLFDKAYDSMAEHEDISSVMDYARKYFSGMSTDDPIWELLSDKRAIAVKDLSEHLR